MRLVHDARAVGVRDDDNIYTSMMQRELVRNREHAKGFMS